MFERTKPFIFIKTSVSLINICVVKQRSLKFSPNCSHDSCFTSERKQSKRFKIVLGLYIKSTYIYIYIIYIDAKRIKHDVKLMNVAAN